MMSGKKIAAKIVCMLVLFLVTSSISMRVGTSASAPSGIRLSWTQDATDTTMTILWETSSSGNSNEVQYGITPACEIGTVSGFSFADSWGVLYNHQIELTGLSPNTKYFYKVSGDSGEWTPVFNFTTAPDSNIEWSFLVAGDSRSYYNDWDEVVGAMVTNENARLLFFGGDILNDFDTQSEWYEWMNPAQRLIGYVPFISNKGNHEDDVTGDPWDNYLNTFAFPSNEEYFSFDYGNSHFIILNTEDSSDSAQKTWLESDLQAASSDPSIEWIFVSHHRPPYSSGGHDSDSGPRDNFVPLYQQYGVDMVFAGHNHFYQRTYPLNCTDIDNPVVSDWGKNFNYYSDTIYAVVGRAGAPEYAPNNNPGWFVEETMSGELHYMKVDVHTNKSIHATTRYTDNTIFDDFWLIKEGVAPPPPPPPPATDTITLIDAGDTWSYSETDPQPVTTPAWNEPGFDDSGWTVSDAPFGFGDSTAYGTVLNDNDGSYYFRKTFELTNASEIQSARVNVSSDNYAQVYLNGIMIDDDGGANHEFDYWNRMTGVSPIVFQNGTNTVAVYVYNSGGSSDAYMDLDLRIKVPEGSVPPPPPSLSPEQVHIATTGDPTEMSITWVTWGMTPTSTVEFGTTSGVYDFSISGTNHSYSGWSGYIHDVILTGLIPDTRYYYRVGDESMGWSDEFDFMSPPDYHKNVTFAAIADHGQSSRAETTTANIIADPSPIDLIVHPGDLSYANGNQPEWDIWFNQIEENVARRPYMIVAGNHETAYDIPATLARFNNPYQQSGSTSEFYYSFNYSMIHFVAICSDVDYDIGSDQYNWLVNDLAAANSDRTNHPWIIVFSHRPMYSSNLEHGSDLGFRTEMEDLLDQYGVDLAIWGHDHAYERTYPVYQETPSDTDPRLYVSPTDTIHMVAGMAGAGLYTSWADPQPSWSAYREATWGYVRVTVDTDGNLHSEFIRNVDNKVRDEFWIVKEGVIPSMPPLTEELNIVPEGDIWLYSEVDPQPVTSPAWNEPGFDDSGWSSGPAPFGFGDSTTYGTVLNDNDGSYYFRKTFDVESVDDFYTVTLYVASDDHALVYLNGILVDDDSGVDHEFEYWNRAVDLPAGALLEGTNTIAVFVFNTDGSSDVYFDLKLDGEVMVNQQPILVLHSGWNLISLPFVQPITDVETVFSSISGSYDAIQCYDASDMTDP
jgi:predicted phosphodiesterase